MTTLSKLESLLRRRRMVAEMFADPAPGSLVRVEIGKPGTYYYGTGTTIEEAIVDALGAAGELTQ